MTIPLKLALSAVLSAMAIAALTAAAAGDTRYDFNPGWRLFVGDPKGAEAPLFDDSSWKPVTPPRPWNEDDPFARGIHDQRTGIA